MLYYYYGVRLIADGTVIADNAETSDLNAQYTHDANVQITFPNGERYLLEITKLKDSY
jgi:hypothetical protein